MLLHLNKLLKETPHRNQLNLQLRKHFPKLSSPTLDVGSKDRRYDRFLIDPSTAIDIKKDIINNIIFGDVNNIPFPNDSFNSILCIEVLEYLNMPEKAIQELYRVLKKDGIMLLSIPFMFREHGDETRLTSKHLSQIFSKNFSNFQIYKIGNAYSIIFDILLIKIYAINNNFIKYFLLLFYLPFSLTCAIRLLPITNHFASGFLVVAQK